MGSKTEQIVVRAQFGEMLTWRARGWKPAAEGHRCDHCGGSYWFKALGRTEKFSCTRCGIAKEVVVR